MIDHITSKLDLALIKHPNAGVFLVADFNRCPVSALLKHFGLKQIVKQPTREKVTLDLILTNMSVISSVGLSDHNSVICTFNRSLIKNLTNKVKIRRNIHCNKTAFGKWLAEYNWSTLYRTVTCEDKLDIFMKVINTGLDCFFPCKSIKLHANDKPWVTPEFKELIKDRQKAYHDGKTKKYNYLRNLANRKGKQLRSNYLDRKMENLILTPENGGIA